MDYMKMVREIERLYPPGRIERSKARLRAVWKLKRPPDRIPFVFVGPPSADEKLEFNMFNGIYTHEESLVGQLEMIIDRASLDDDYIPSLSPGYRQGTIPTAYGAKEDIREEHIWVTPMISDVSEIYELGHPDFRKQGVAAEILDRARFFRSATEGRMAIQLADMQGPLDLASNMWGTGPLLEAMYTDPEAVHHLLQVMTDAFIEFVRLLEEAAEGDLIPIHFPIVWMPPGSGVALSEDLLALLSPQLYPIFGRPYNERIADAFGGVVIHSCGSTEHNLKTLSQTRRIMGVDLGITETALPAIVESIAKNAVIMAHSGEVRCNNLPALTPENHVRQCMTSFKQNDLRGIVIVLPTGITREEAQALNPLALELAQYN